MSSPENEEPTGLAVGSGADQDAVALATVANGSAISNGHTMRRHHAETCARLKPLVDRLCTTHCWKKTTKRPVHIDEPFDAAKMNEHLFGGTTYGLALIAPGESVTRAACLDVDNHGGMLADSEVISTVVAVRDFLRGEGYQPHLFRSSGGAGVHIWLLWDEPQDARSVRQMLSSALAAFGLADSPRGLARQGVEAFPKQNNVRPDGSGSQVFLPFRGRAFPIADDGSNATDFEWVMSPPVPAVEAPVLPPRAPLEETEWPRLRSALKAIPNSDDTELGYDDWFRVICGIHSATQGSDEGLDLAQEFSARASQHDADFLEHRAWAYLRDDRESGATAQTIYNIASAYGWQDPDVEAAFDVLEPQAPAPLRYQPVQAAKFAKGKPREMLIKRVMPHGGLVVVFGASGSGKSFFVIDVVCAIAQGKPWNGRHVKKGRVVYVFAEGAGGGMSRIEAYGLHHGVLLEELDLHLISAAPNLVEAGDVKDLIAAVKSIGPVSVIVCDTLAQMTAGSDENASRDMSRAVASCQALGAATGATVLLVAHSGKDASKGIRGWSGIKGAIDAEIEIVRADDNRVATISKVKDGAGENDQYGFRLLEIDLGVDQDGDRLTSCVLDHVTSAIASVKAERTTEKMGAKQRLVLRVIQELTSIGGEHPTPEEVADAAKGQMVKTGKEGARDRRRELALNAINSLLEAGRLQQIDGRLRVVGGAE